MKYLTRNHSTTLHVDVDDIALSEMIDQHDSTTASSILLRFSSCSDCLDFAFIEKKLFMTAWTSHENREEIILIRGFSTAS